MAEGTAAGVAADATPVEQGSTDGRSARRERNIDAVVDAAIELFTEGVISPTIEQVAGRSGISVRSIYRYFADPTELHDAAFDRHRAQAEPLAQLPPVGDRSFEMRLDDFVAARLRLYDGIGATYRAALASSFRSERVRHVVGGGRVRLRAQLGEQFAPELSGLTPQQRDAVATAADVLTQLDAIDLLRVDRGLSVDETAAALRAGLSALFGKRSVT